MIFTEGHLISGGESQFWGPGVPISVTPKGSELDAYSKHKSECKKLTQIHFFSMFFSFCVGENWSEGEQRRRKLGGEEGEGVEEKEKKDKIPGFYRRNWRIP